ncbi:(Fe-S)-binding protein [Candidatus Amarolinea aalborgensis]|jgi:L-lactate dehydrogenase complex protein LldE|uniref:(Fe-S)-binding protein n=1 Tax=Candidatus Amarolinea aalborgensis TaxID=2249329 RepID=UPI003BF9BDE8
MSTSSAAATPRPRRVSLFVTCLIDHLSPQTAAAVVTVLERQGITVDVPAGQTCCGQPAFNGGFWDEARQMARHTIRVLEETNDSVVVPSGSCADMIVHHYPELLRDEPAWLARSQRLAQRVVEFSQFLVDVLGVTDVGAVADGALTYHASCHLLRGLGIGQQPVALLAHVRGAQITPLPDADQCCGFGGLFSVKFPSISEDMLANKLRRLAETGADCVVGCDLSCLLHISAGLHRRGQSMRAVHLADILARTDAAPHDEA